MLKKTTILALIFITLISFFLISFQSKGKIIIDKIHLYSFFTPIDFVKNFFNDILYLRQENQKLKEQLYNMILKERSNHELIEENRRLKNLLNLKEKKKEFIAASNVIKRGSNKFLKTLWINKGQKSGIVVNMPVITLNGLIGKIIFTSDDFSEVLLLTDPNFSVAVRIERTRVEGILNGNGTSLCSLKYIPLEEEVIIGDRLITSGTDGIFPEGIPVGVVKKVDRKIGIFQNIDVIPLQPETQIEEVAVIKSLI